MCCFKRPPLLRGRRERNKDIFAAFFIARPEGAFNWGSEEGGVALNTSPISNIWVVLCYTVAAFGEPRPEREHYREKERKDTGTEEAKKEESRKKVRKKLVSDEERKKARGKKVLKEGEVEKEREKERQSDIKR